MEGRQIEETHVNKLNFQGRFDILPIDVVANAEKETVVLVNSNRLNWLMALAMRSIDNDEYRVKIVTTIQEVLNSAENERTVYVPMRVRDVKECFGKTLDEMPKNTFIRLE